MLSVFASGRDESELVRFGWGFATGSGGQTGLFLASLPRIEKREREKKWERICACVSVWLWRHRIPQRASPWSEGGSGVDRDYPPGLFLVLIGGGNSLGENSPGTSSSDSKPRQMSCVPAIWCIRAGRERAVTLGLLELHITRFHFEMPFHNVRGALNYRFKFIIYQDVYVILHNMWPISATN